MTNPVVSLHQIGKDGEKQTFVVVSQKECLLALAIPLLVMKAPISPLEIGP